VGLLLVCILPEGQFPGMDVANSRTLIGHPLAGLTLWVRPTPHPPTASLEEIRAHHRIVADAWESRPAVLPARFGQWFATLEELTAALAPGLEGHAQALERVAGAGEFSVRILDPEAIAKGTPATPASGTEYLRAAAARERERAEAGRRGGGIAGELREALGPLVLGERVDGVPEPPGLAVATHLVRRSEERAYGTAVDRFAAEHRALRFVRTGPWPPWSFTG
jgi:hypothetical protein